MIYKLFLQQCIRSKEVWISLLLITLLGIVGIIIGSKHLEKQQEAISEVKVYQEQHFDRQISLHNEDLGLLLYYTKFAYIDTLNPLAGLSVGQSDVNPTVKQISIKTFEAQKFDTDLINPMNVQSGNLDLSFVIIYLFPLLVIVLTFNVISEETETGTWQLVAIQATSKLQFIISKLLIRLLLLFIILILLFFIAKIKLNIPLNSRFLLMIGLSMLYIIFWFTFSFFVIVFKKSSGFNALSLLSIWLLLIILLPAGINAYVSSKYPVPEALSTAIAQRDGYHTKWDTDKLSTIEKFYQHYPQYKKYGYPTEGFNWLWYYAMQQMGDDDSKIQQDALNDKIKLREETSKLIAYIIPNIHVQLSFNHIAGTSMNEHMNYLRQTEAFHEKLRLFFYPKIFEEQYATTIDWKLLTPEYYEIETEIKPLKIMTPLLLACLVMILIALPVLRKL
jgi:ABC-2 type transport system permease protein